MLASRKTRMSLIDLRERAVTPLPTRAKTAVTGGPNRLPPFSAL